MSAHVLLNLLNELRIKRYIEVQWVDKWSVAVAFLGHTVNPV